MNIGTFERKVFHHSELTPYKSGASHPLLLNVRGETWAVGYYAAGKFWEVDMDGSKYEVNILGWAYLNE